MSTLLDKNLDNGCWGLEQAASYKGSILDCEPIEFGGEYLSEKSEWSVDCRLSVEKADSVSFDEFLAGYFTL